MSGTAAADWEREEEASSAGLSAKARPKRRRHLARHRLFRKCDRWRIVSSGRCPAAQCVDTRKIRNRTMKKPAELGAIDIAAVQSRMLMIRNQQVLLDRDVAALYGVETKAINQAVKRNAGRFEDGYLFQLDAHEVENWKSHIVTSNLSEREIASLKMGMRRAPYAFTERGLYMLATILNSDRAVRATKAIIETYAKVRSMVRDMEAIQTEKAGSPEQVNLLTRAGHKLAGLIGDNLSTVSRKTTIELNLALLKITHEVAKGKE